MQYTTLVLTIYAAVAATVGAQQDTYSDFVASNNAEEFGTYNSGLRKLKASKAKY